MNEVAVVEQKGIEVITEAKIMEYLDSAGMTSALSLNEKKMFVNIAREFGLNPFKREIHITAYGQGDKRKCSIIPGYEVYIKRAERTGKLDGWKVWTEGEGKTLKAVVEIYRKDQKYPFLHDVYYTECVQMNRDGFPNAVWAKQPRFMTKKVAIGQAFRLCFPDELGGMPYEESELPQERNVTEENGKSLANGALNEQYENKGNAPPNNNPPENQQTLLEGIKAILFAVNPDKFPYFSVSEKEMEKAVVEGARDLQALKNQHERLKKELSKREAAFEPIPFDTPAMYTEQEAVPHDGDVDIF
jgi:phage recombination protein Bet